MQKKTFGRNMVGSASILALAMAGCGGGGGGNEGVVNGVKYTVNSAATIAQESADDYSSNVNGIITGSTLKSWLDAWTTNRPAGITGKLIIFQVSAGPAGSEYIKPDGTNIFTYLSPSSEWIETRSNGVIETQSMVPSGATMDALMKKYNVDPTKDMIVVALGTGSTTNAMAQGRVWYALRYWGVAKEHLSILNGGSQWLNGNGLTSTDFQATATTAPNSGTFSVRSLTTVNTALQATFEDVLAITGADSNNKGDHAFLWDARSLGQYSAGEMVELGEDQDPDTAGAQACATAYCTPTSTSNYMWSFQNGGSRQGHPGGALQLQYTRMLDSTKGFAYKPKAELAAYVDGTPDANGNGLLDGSYNPVGTGNGYQPGDTVYVYCETTFRAMITGIVSAVVLGKPTRFYDGAMVEWNSLSYLLDKDGKYILPIDSPWRTDVRSFYRPATSAALVNTRTINNAYAGNAKLIVNSDRAYKTGESVPSTSGSGSMPGNPCGG